MKTLKYKEESFSHNNITVTRKEINKMMKGEIPYNHERYLVFQKGMSINNERYKNEGLKVSKRHISKLSQNVI